MKEELEKSEFTDAFIKCDCGTCMLSVMREKYENITTYYLAMFKYTGYSDKMGFWRRIWVALRILRTGKVFYDQLVLNEDEAKKLVDFINEK